MLNLSPGTTSTYTLTNISNTCGEGSAMGSVTVYVADPKFNDCGEGCFTTNIVEAETSGSCTTYTLKVNGGGNCRYGLSHYEVAIACGRVSNMSNSGGWPMSVGLDPTSGVYGIKVDNIDGIKNNDSFTVTYTVCSTDACDAAEGDLCGQWVAYKAGTCVYYGQANPALPATGGGPIAIGAAPELIVFPNPAGYTQEITLKVKHILIPSPTKVMVRKATGNVIWQGTTRLVGNSENTAYYTFPSRLAPGTYFISIQLWDYMTTDKLIVY
jgi:hypothetical protein